MFWLSDAQLFSNDKIKLYSVYIKNDQKRISASNAAVFFLQLADAASRCFGFLMLSFSVNITDKIIALRSYIISGLGIAFCGLFSPPPTLFFDLFEILGKHG